LLFIGGIFGQLEAIENWNKIMFDIIPSGFQVDSKWIPSGLQVDSKWIPSGFQAIVETVIAQTMYID
jgi:hypothetical protein